MEEEIDGDTYARTFHLASAKPEKNRNTETNSSVDNILLWMYERTTVQLLLHRNKTLNMIRKANRHCYQMKVIFAIIVTSNGTAAKIKFPMYTKNTLIKMFYNYSDCVKRNQTYYLFSTQSEKEVY